MANVVEKPRNYGIDCLRIISMMMVVVLHILGQGGVLGDSVRSVSHYQSAWFLEIACYCAVNVYGLISGYVGYGKAHNMAGFIRYYLQVIFYTIITTVLFGLVYHEMISGGKLLETIFPFAYGVYWYYTAFFCLFLFMPFLDKLVYSLDRREAKKMIFLLYLVFSILQAVFNREFAGTEYGYSFLWLAIMYLTGACIRKFNTKYFENNWYNLAGYFMSVLFTWFLLMGIEFKLSISYTSPMIVLCAVLLLLFFRDLRISVRTGKVIVGISTVAFDVYLIHQEPLIREAFIIGSFRGFLSMEPIVMVLAVLASSIAIWLVCSLIGRLRIMLFSVIKVDKLCAWIEEKVTVVIGKYL